MIKLKWHKIFTKIIKTGEKIMKKRLLALLVLAVVMVLALASCEGFIGDILDQINPPVEENEYVVYFMAGEGDRKSTRLNSSHSS